MVLVPADSLGQFAMSVDTIDDDAYEKVLNLVADYFMTTLGASFYAVRLDGVRVVSGDERHPGLKTAALKDTAP